MDIRPINNADQHEAALRRIEALWGAPVGTPDGDELSVLIVLVNAYEDEHYPIEAPDPVDAIRAHMDMAGLEQKDLAAILGSRSRASEILNRRRALTVEMIHAISTAWRIPADSLVKPYELAA
jgi:HTH-type transcriptional regulator/antitoxin HigA